MDIDPAWYSDVADLDFGVQKCRSVQLLSMTTTSRRGNYNKLGQVPLGGDEDEMAVDEESEESHKECCAPLKPEPNVFIAVQVSTTRAVEITYHVISDQDQTIYFDLRSDQGQILFTS